MTDAHQIESRPAESIQTTIERYVVAKQAPLDSEKQNRFSEQTLNDILTLAQQGNVTAQQLIQGLHIRSHETDTSRQRVIALEAQIAFDRRVKALQGHHVTHWVDLHDGRDLSYVSGADISKRATISTNYGQATVPLNAIESRLYSLRLLAGGTVVPNTLVFVTTGVFDKAEGDGPTDYENGGTVEETDPKLAADGNNQHYWRRRVIFPLESDVSEVECEATITIPESANLHANVITCHPYPLGNVDITGLYTAPDLSGAFTPLPSFEEMKNARKERWFFTSQKVSQVKIRFRQRNWFEENGRKVFEYGSQEIGVYLTEWDKNYDAVAEQLTDNHAFVTRVDAEPGFLFYRMYGFYADPDWTTEPTDNRHLHFVVAKDANGADVVWHSDLNGAPQSLQNPIDLGGVSTLYVITTMNWVETASVGSPFPANTTPFLRGFGIDCTYKRGA